MAKKTGSYGDMQEKRPKTKANGDEKNKKLSGKSFLEAMAAAKKKKKK